MGKPKKEKLKAKKRQQEIKGGGHSCKVMGQPITSSFLKEQGEESKMEGKWLSPHSQLSGATMEK